MKLPKFLKRRNPWVTLRYEEDNFIPKDYSEQGVSSGAKFERNLVLNHDL